MTKLSEAWHTIRETVDIVSAHVIDEISVRIMLAQLRWSMRTHKNQPEMAEVFREAERELLNKAWGRKATGKEPPK